MNEYYEANLPSGKKPIATSSSAMTNRFIKEKYVKKLWVDEEEDDPVYLFKSGELSQKQKKQERKEKKKQEKAKKKEEKKRKKERKMRKKAKDEEKGKG